MQDNPILGQLILGYGAVIDRQRAVVATRLTVFPEPADAVPDALQLQQALEAVCPESGAALSLRLRPMDSGAGHPPTAGIGLFLNVASEPLLRALLAAPPVSRHLIEVPAFIAGDPDLVPALVALSDGGGAMALKGQPRGPLAAELDGCFSLQLDDADAPAARGKAPALVRTGVRSPAELQAAFDAGAVAATGWPFGDPPEKPAGKVTVPPELQVILELINRVDREEHVDRLEAVLKNDPTLAFRLLRYINSPGFGLSVEISSFRHALMILGYQRLKRWLVLLLASASKDASMKPVMFAAVRRGLIMEEFARSSGDADMRGELFICGIFSLLDRLMRQPFAELLRLVPMPERVHQVLLRGEGPFAPYLELAQAIENESAFDIREAAARVMMSASEVNRALLTALTTATQLDGA